MIHARGGQFIGQKRFRRFSRRRCLDRYRETGLGFDLAIIAADLHQVFTRAADQHDHGELAAKNRHLAIFDITVVARNKCGDALNQADLIRSDRGENEMIFVCHSVSLMNSFKQFKSFHVGWPSLRRIGTVSHRRNLFSSEKSHS
jgi:hypothetical protein